jgi:hypothetical protein
MDSEDRSKYAGNLQAPITQNKFPADLLIPGIVKGFNVDLNTSPPVKIN